MNQPMIELPKYKSHKIVRALSIAAIEVHEDKSATIAPSLTAYAPFKTQPGWAERFKGSEEDKGYYVVYGDGYASWSPTEAFESGYIKLRDDHTPLSELKAALQADEDYAWTWQCNLACIGIDSVSDMANLAEDEHLTPHQAANRRAAQFMSNAFDVDIRTNEHWKEFEAQWLNEAVVSVTTEVVGKGMAFVRAQQLGQPAESAYSSQVFWSKCKAHLDFISSLDILVSELTHVDFSQDEIGCSVSPACFLRLAQRFGIETLQQVAYGNDQLFFIENGVEFRVVLSANDMQRFEQEFNVFVIVKNERP